MSGFEFGKLDDIVKLFEEIASKEIQVGIPAVNTEREHQEKGQPINNATLAAIMNNGSPANNIPPRPFMTMGRQRAQAETTRLMSALFKAIMAGDRKEALNYLEKIGSANQSAVKEAMNAGPFAKLAESTLKEKLRAGKSIEDIKPLIDTGELQSKITYKVE